MSYRDLPPFRFTFEPMLKTREIVRVVLQITAAGRGTYFNVSLFVPTFSLDGVIAQVRQQLHAEAQAATNRWALSFRTIEDAHLAHVALSHELERIASPDFTIASVVVQEIVPLTPKALPPPPAPPPPPPPPREKTPSEKVIEPLAVMMTTLTDFLEFAEKSQTENARLYENKTIGQRLKNKLADVGQRIISPDERY